MSSHTITRLTFATANGWTVAGQQTQFFTALKIPGKSGPVTTSVRTTFKNPYDIHQA